MDYVKIKLSSEDKEILKVIFDKLEDITIPSSFRNKGGQGHQIRTGSVSQKNARQTCFGLTYHHGQVKKSKSTIKYPHILPLFIKFIKSHNPGFKFKSVYVNRNVVIKKHVDSKNMGKSLLVGFGEYTGGRTTIYDKNGKNGKKFHIKTNSLIFNGSELPHESEPFKGIRYSLVFFS